MRQVMPHRSNIDIDGCTCKSFFHPLRRRRLKALNGGMPDRASGSQNLEIFACSISSLQKRTEWERDLAAQNPNISYAVLTLLLMLVLGDF